MRQAPPTPIQLSELPAGPKAGTHLLTIDDLPAHGGKELIFTEGMYRASILVQKTNNEIGVFINMCPHAGTPLNMFDENFMDTSGRHLLCRTHGAIFDPVSGVCVRGPCKGEWLRPVAHTISDGNLYSA